MLYEKISFVAIEGPGVYYAKIANKEGVKFSELTTPKAIVPAPTEIEGIVVEGNDEIFSEERPVVLNAVTAFADAEKVYQNVKYQWLKDGEIIEDATSASYNVVASGEYTVKAVNHWNKAVSAEVVSSNAWPVYPEAIAPVVISFLPDV